MRRNVWTSALAVALGAVLVAGCGAATKSGKRYQRKELQKTLAKLDQTGLVIGEFAFEGPPGVLDGDTVRVRALKTSMRLLGIDTEETFKNDADRKAYARGFKQYLKELRGDSPRPVKAATPMGEEAADFARKFFDGVTTVRLERDHPGEIRDFYGRYLAYVFAQKDGKWVNYNIEVVRAGYTPYYQKYGRSRRFHQEFIQAEEEARAAKRGIWDPFTESYDDYDERLEWWNARGAQIQAFEDMGESQPDIYIPITRWNAPALLEKRLGREVVVLGTVQEIRRGTVGPSILTLSRSRGQNLDVVFFDKDVFNSIEPEQYKGEYVQVHGWVNKYTNKYRRRTVLQLVVHNPSQVSTPGSPVVLGSLGEPPPPPAPAMRPAAYGGDINLETEPRPGEPVWSDSEGDMGLDFGGDLPLPADEPD